MKDVVFCSVEVSEVTLMFYNQLPNSPHSIHLDAAVQMTLTVKWLHFLQHVAPEVEMITIKFLKRLDFSEASVHWDHIVPL